MGVDPSCRRSAAIDWVTSETSSWLTPDTANASLTTSFEEIAPRMNDTVEKNKPKSADKNTHVDNGS